MFLEWNPTWTKMDSTNQMSPKPVSGLRETDTKDDIQYHSITEKSPRRRETRPEHLSLPAREASCTVDAGGFLSILLLGGNGQLARYKSVKMCPFLSCALYITKIICIKPVTKERERELSQGRACPVSLRTHVNDQNIPKNSKKRRHTCYLNAVEVETGTSSGLSGQKSGLLVEF